MVPSFKKGSTVDTLAAITQRYSCRDYAPTPVPAATLHQIGAAGLHAPSAVNRQPWRVITVSDPALIAELEQAGMAALQARDKDGYDRIMGRGGRLLYGAPALVIIARDTAASNYSTYDVGIVAAHIALAATALGVNNVIAAMPGSVLVAPGGEDLSRRLGIPEGFEFGLSVLLGYAAGAPGAQHAVDLSKLIEVRDAG